MHQSQAAPRTIPATRTTSHRQRGGAALEYILVSTFAGAMSMAALAYLSQVVQHKLQDLGERLGGEAPSLELAWPFDDNGG